MLKSNIDVFFVTSFLCSPVLIVSSNRVSRGVYENKFLWLSFCDMTVPSKSNVPSL